MGRGPDTICSLAVCVADFAGNLETVLESKDIHLTMLDKLKYARDIALGCNWLHHSNPLIIHRGTNILLLRGALGTSILANSPRPIRILSSADLKPSNLLLDDNGRVKVCDFGLSLAQPEHSKGFRSSRIVGTPLYTSPETIKGKTITTKADVYSYGVVLYAHHPSAPSVIIIMIIFIFILLVALNFGICFILTLFVMCRWQILTRLEPFLECVRVVHFFYYVDLFDIFYIQLESAHFFFVFLLLLHHRRRTRMRSTKS